MGSIGSFFKKKQDEKPGEQPGIQSALPPLQQADPFTQLLASKQDVLKDVFTKINAEEVKNDAFCLHGVKTADALRQEITTELSKQSPDLSKIATDIRALFYHDNKVETDADISKDDFLIHLGVEKLGCSVPQHTKEIAGYPTDKVVVGSQELQDSATDEFVHFDGKCYPKGSPGYEQALEQFYEKYVYPRLPGAMLLNDPVRQKLEQINSIKAAIIEIVKPGGQNLYSVLIRFAGFTPRQDTTLASVELDILNFDTLKPERLKFEFGCQSTSEAGLFPVLEEMVLKNTDPMHPVGKIKLHLTAALAGELRPAMERVFNEAKQSVRDDRNLGSKCWQRLVELYSNQMGIFYGNAQVKKLSEAQKDFVLAVGLRSDKPTLGEAIETVSQLDGYVKSGAVKAPSPSRPILQLRPGPPPAIAPQFAPQVPTRQVAMEGQPVTSEKDEENIITIRVGEIRTFKIVGGKDTILLDFGARAAKQQ